MTGEEGGEGEEGKGGGRRRPGYGMRFVPYYYSSSSRRTSFVPLPLRLTVHSGDDLKPRPEISYILL